MSIFIPVWVLWLAGITCGISVLFLFLLIALSKSNFRGY